MKYTLLVCLSLMVLSCNQGAQEKDHAYWEKKVLETMNTEKGPEGGGANYADKVEIITTKEREDGSTTVRFLWWGEYRNGSIQGNEPRKVTREALTYEFDKNGDRINEAW